MLLGFSERCHRYNLSVHYNESHKGKRVKWSRYRPGVAERVGRGIALLFHDRGTRRGWVVSVTARPHFTPGKDQVPILQEAGWAPGLVWTGGIFRPDRDSVLDCPARSQSLYWLSYPAHIMNHMDHVTGMGSISVPLLYTDLIFLAHPSAHLDHHVLGSPCLPSFLKDLEVQ